MPKETLANQNASPALTPPHPSAQTPPPFRKTRWGRSLRLQGTLEDPGKLVKTHRKVHQPGLRGKNLFLSVPLRRDTGEGEGKPFLEKGSSACPEVPPPPKAPPLTAQVVFPLQSELKGAEKM